MKDQFSQLFKLVEILMPRFAAYLRSKEATYMNFCFKWLLILFKREFSYDDIKVLWEALWSDVVPKNFHLLIAASIFYGEMDKIMKTCEDVNQLLQYINCLSGKINVKTTLSRAAGFYQQLLEVNDQLPDDVRVTLGFIPPPPAENASCFADDSTLFFSASYGSGGNTLDASAAATSGEETRFLLDRQNSPCLEVGQDAGDVDLENQQSSSRSDINAMVMHDPFAPGASQPITFLPTPKRTHPNRGTH
uniref:TBC1 domain family member 15 n=3 Tax=Schistocephalus solidus TaxID=70667 RepID=A0A0X3NPG5_SCHSO